MFERLLMGEFNELNEKLIHMQPLTGPFIILWWNWVKQLSLFVAHTYKRRGLFSQSLCLK